MRRRSGAGPEEPGGARPRPAAIRGALRGSAGLGHGPESPPRRGSPLSAAPLTRAARPPEENAAEAGLGVPPGCAPTRLGPDGWAAGCGNRKDLAA